jgi:hypothetical protein
LKVLNPSQKHSICSFNHLAETFTEYDDDPGQPPQTPAPLFVAKAFRTALFGTPAQKEPQPRTRLVRPKKTEERPSTPTEEKKKKPAPQEEQPQKEKAQRRRGYGLHYDESELEFSPVRPARRQKLDTDEPQHQKSAEPAVEKAAPPPFKLAPHNGNLFDSKAAKSIELPKDLAQTPGRPASPTKGILMTPGAAMRQRKAVTFDATTKKEEVKGSRVRSGLPTEFPGKFPSPWTPKSGTPKRSSGSLEETSLPINHASKKRAISFEVTEATRIQDVLNEASDDDGDMQILHDGDLTIDMTAPKSASGQYWKEHAENLEGLALIKVGKLRDRCNLAIEYAKRKDEYCVSLCEKIREYTQKSKLLKDEIKRLHQLEQLHSTPEGTALSEAMHMLSEKEATIGACETEMSRMQATIEDYEARLKKYEDLLNNREEKITELSMTMLGSGHEEEDSEQVQELKSKLRKARLEVKELGPLRVECRNYKSRVSILEKEKENLEAQLERMKSIGDESTASRPSARSASETRLRTRIEELEKDKRDLKAEMRTKVAEISKERREAEKSLRSEIAELKARVSSEELDKKELAQETARLRDVIGDLELRAAANGRSSADGDIDEWQKKHRATTQELRKAKEEIVALREQLENRQPLHEQLENRQPLRERSDNEQEAPLRSRRISTTPSTGAQKSSPPQKHGEAASSAVKTVSPTTSVDSAINRSYDRGSSRKQAQSSSPPFNLASTREESEKPYDDIANSSLLDLPPPAPAEPKENPGSNMEESFGYMRRLKASPRPSVVSWEITPPQQTVKRRNFAVRKPGADKKDSVFADPARQTAAEKRLAERKAKRMAERKAAQAAGSQLLGGM